MEQDRNGKMIADQSSTHFQIDVCFAEFEVWEMTLVEDEPTKSGK